jgi:hypothetical protein
VRPRPGLGRGGGRRPAGDRGGCRSAHEWHGADRARVAEPADDFQRFDLALWLEGRAPGDLAASERNPLLFP